MGALPDVFGEPLEVGGRHYLTALPGEPSTAEQLREAFAKRGYAEKYQAAGHDSTSDTTAVAERAPKKLKQVEANYRSAFSAARCGVCSHFRSGSCELVEGLITPDSVCDLFQPKLEDVGAAADRAYAERIEASGVRGRDNA